MQDEDRRWEEVPKSQLYLERVEAAAMGKLVQFINDGKLTEAWDLARLMGFLSIV